MDREDKKNLALGVMLLIIVASAIIYFFWGFINEGYLEINGEAPFTVGLMGGEQYPCLSSPCTIALESGTTEIILKKDEYESKVETVDIPLRRTSKLKVKFVRLPYIVQVENIPSSETNDKFEFEFDNSNKMFKLVRSDDEQKTALIYFQNKLKSPKFFGSGEILLIFEPSTGLAYKVDLVLKKREQIFSGDFGGIESGSWSANGKYFIFTRSSMPNYWIYSEGRTTETELITQYTRTSWALSDTLVFVTQQDIQTQTNTPQNSITPNFVIGKYDPKSETYISSEKFMEIDALPDELISASNGEVLYFETSSGKYQVNL